MWALIARPSEWHRWSPHVRGAEGLGEPEVEAGANGKVVLRGGVKVGAEVTAVEPGRSWSWRAMGMEIHHSVAEISERRTRLEMAVEAQGALSPVAAAYSQAVGLIMRNIARIAEQDD